MTTLKDDLVIWNALANPELIEVVSEPVFKTITPPPTLNCSGINLSMGSTGSNVTLLQEFLNSWLKSMGSTFQLATDGNFGAVTNATVMSFQIRQTLYVDGIVGPQTCPIVQKPGINKSLFIYVNPIDGSYSLNAIQAAGFSDIFMAPDSNNTYATLNSQCKALGLKLHAWLQTPSVTTVQQIASEGVNIHIDVEEFDSVSDCLTYLTQIGDICKTNNVLGSIVTKDDPIDALTTYNLPSYSQMIQHLSFIVVMDYMHDYGETDATMTTNAQKVQAECPGQIWIALESYESDDNPIAKTQAEVLQEINDVEVYENGIGWFRYGLLNYGGLSG